MYFFIHQFKHEFLVLKITIIETILLRYKHTNFQLRTLIWRPGHVLKSINH